MIEMQMRMHDEVHIFRFHSVPGQLARKRSSTWTEGALDVIVTRTDTGVDEQDVGFGDYQEGVNINAGVVVGGRVVATLQVDVRHVQAVN
jgi:hypothetical protein